MEFYLKKLLNSEERNTFNSTLSTKKIQSDLINKSFVIKTDSRASKFVLEKKCQEFVSKQIFARWQAILSCFNSQILPIKGVENPFADYLSREFLLSNKNSP